jgi:hypothetical protein
MILPELNTRVIESDPYRPVVIHDGCLVFAECSGSQKQEVADEIVKRCNAYPKLLQLISDARDELVQLSFCEDGLDELIEELTKARE